MRSFEIFRSVFTQFHAIDGLRFFGRFAYARLRSKLTFGLRRRASFFLGKSCVLQFRRNIFVEKNVRIGDFCTLSGLGKSGLVILENSSIGSFSRVVVSTSPINPGEFIKIGRNVGIGEYASLGGSGGLSIGDNTIIGQYFSAHPENHNFRDSNKLIRLQGTTRAAINIGENCWIGSKVTVLAGVSIGNNSIIGAGAVVVKDIPPDTVAAGNPCVSIKKRL